MTVTDAHGRTTALRQYTAGTPSGALTPPPGTTYQTTSYSYDRLGQPTTVTDPDNNQWANTYDLRVDPGWPAQLETNTTALAIYRRHPKPATP